MSVKIVTAQKVEVLSIAVEALRRPADDPKVMGLREQAERLREEVAQLQEQQAVVRPAIVTAQAALAKAVGAGDAAGRKKALESIDDSTAIDSRLAARVPILAKAAVVAEGELADALTAASMQAGVEWDEARRRLDANLEDLHAAERSCRQEIGRLEQARLIAFSSSMMPRHGLISLRALRSVLVGNAIINIGEQFGVPLARAKQLVESGACVYVDQARAAAANQLAGLP